MARIKIEPQEKLVKKIATKEVYRFIDKENGINILSKEIYKKEDKVVLYPFYNKSGDPKYITIRKISFIGFKEKLPRGTLKNPITGYGFTNVLSPLLYYLQDKFKIESVVVQKTGKSSLKVDRKEVVFSYTDLDRFYPVISNLYAKQKQETLQLVLQLLGKIFPTEVDAPYKSYVKNSVYSFMEKWKEHIGDFSEQDVNSIAEIFSQLSKNNESVSSKVMLKSREAIEELFIEDVVKKFEEYLTQKTETEALEERWQTFFKENSWIFSQLLSIPVILYEDKAYVGGKNISNVNGKIADFLIQNNLTKNAAFIEIKTHKSSILKKGRPYRGKDVFPMSDDLSGAINQVLDQRDNFQKEYYSLRAKSKKPIETYNSKCVVVIGEMKDLNEDEIKSFELFRSNSKDVDIVTYDELFERLKILHALMTGN